VILRSRLTCVRRTRESHGDGEHENDEEGDGETPETGRALHGHGCGLQRTPGAARGEAAGASY